MNFKIIQNNFKKVLFGALVFGSVYGLITGAGSLYATQMACDFSAETKQIPTNWQGTTFVPANTQQVQEYCTKTKVTNFVLSTLFFGACSGLTVTAGGLLTLLIFSVINKPSESIK
jgi:hypothetical protein